VDVTGGQSPSSTITIDSWSATITIPEPPAGTAGALPLVGIGLVTLIRGRHRKRR